MERETGIEPATNSLEGCDSTTELLPPPRRAAFASRRYGGQPSPDFGAKVGGQGRIRTSVGTRPADLQSAAIDRSATYPFVLSHTAIPEVAATACRCCVESLDADPETLTEAGAAPSGAGGGI